MLQHVEWSAAPILTNPFSHAVVDAKWRVTTLRQRMAKLQAQLDEAVAEEKKVMAAAKEFMKSGKVQDDFFPDLSTPTRKIRKEYREEINFQHHKAIQDGQTDYAERIDKLLESAGIKDWRVSDFETNGYVDKIIISRLSPKQGAFKKVRPPSIRAALRDGIKAYYAAWNKHENVDPKKRARLSARAALKVFYEFDGSELPKNLKLDGDLFNLDTFKKVVAFEHRNYLLPERPRGQHLSPFQVRVDGSGHDLIDDFGFGQRNIDWEEVDGRLRKKMLERNSDWEEVDGRLRKKATEGKSGNGHDPPH